MKEALFNLTKNRIKEYTEVFDLLIGREKFQFEVVAFEKGLQLIMHKQFGRLNVILVKHDGMYDMEVLFTTTDNEHIHLNFEYDSTNIESIVTKIKGAIEKVESCEKALA